MKANSQKQHCLALRYSDISLSKAVVLNLLYLATHFAIRHNQTTPSAAWRSGLERRFYDDPDRKVNSSTPNLVSLLRPWIRYFMAIISAWRN